VAWSAVVDTGFVCLGPRVTEEFHPHRIPGAESATVGDDRIVSYLLNEEHEIGKHKARVFKALGYTTENAGDFEAVILDQVPTVEGRFSRANGHGGENWEATVQLPTTTGGAVEMRTYWEVKPGDPPRFLTAKPPKPIPE
jgi:hypothetical protein